MYNQLSAINHKPITVKRLLAAALLVLVLMLLVLEKPWQVDVAAKLSAGEKVALSDYVVDGIWWALLVNFALMVMLCLTSGWWLRLVPRPATTELLWRPRSKCRLFIILLIMISGFALVERAPRLTHSLWNDEEHSLRRYVLGYEKVRDDGSLQFKPD